MFVFASLAVTSHLIAVAAGDFPVFDLKLSCRGTEAAAVNQNRDQGSCVRGEEVVRDQLMKDWRGFPAQDKTSCIGLVTSGGPPSYTELITCLELKRDVRRLRQQGGSDLDDPQALGSGRGKGR